MSLSYFSCIPENGTKQPDPEFDVEFDVKKNCVFSLFIFSKFAEKVGFYSNCQLSLNQPVHSSEVGGCEGACGRNKWEINSFAEPTKIPRCFWHVRTDLNNNNFNLNQPSNIRLTNYFLVRVIFSKKLNLKFSDLNF